MDIVERSEWHARRPRARHVIPTPTPRLWLHHTAGALDAGGNGVWWDDVAGIQRFHMDGRGWSDIAYSFVIGGGQVFEGRGAGVAGGHTQGDNTRSHAICLIGSYDFMTPTDRDLDAIVELAVHGHRQGWWPNQITGGHRNAPGAQTACPGNQLDARIGYLNERILTRLTPPPTSEDAMARTCIPTNATRMPNSRFPFFRLTEDSQLVLAYNGARLKRTDGTIYGVPFMRLGPLASPPVGICEAPGGPVVVVCGDGGTIDVAA